MIKYSFLCGLLLVITVLFLVWHVGIRFIRYGLPEKDKTGKIKAILTGLGFVIWGFMGVIDSVSPVAQILLIERCIIVVAQHMILVGQLKPDVIARILCRK